MKNYSVPEEKKPRTVVAYLFATIFVVFLVVMEFIIPESDKNETLNTFAKIAVIGTWCLSIFVLIEDWKLIKIYNQYRELQGELQGEKMSFKTEKQEFDEMKSRATNLSEISEISIKNFKYIIEKIEIILRTHPQRREKLKRIIYLSPLNGTTIDEVTYLNMLAREWKLIFEWNITEKTENRDELQKTLITHISKYGNTYLTGELPVFDKLLIVPGIIIVAFIGDIWFSWNLTDHDILIDDIKEKVILTPFSRKIRQFFGLGEVHRSISCYLSHLVNVQGFMIDANHSYLWLTEPEQLFHNITNYQAKIIAKFEEVSDELRPMSKEISANLPLIDNYRAIISDEKVKEWLKELKEEASRRQTGTQQLLVTRYIYIRGKKSNGSWEIENTYLNELRSFLENTYLNSLSPNYHVQIVLFDRTKLEELYRDYKSSKDVTLPEKEIISNWIWFKCQDNFHVLQYEIGLTVEPKVAESLAIIQHKTIEEVSKISAFMFADAVDPSSQLIMRKYLDHIEFLRYCQQKQMTLSLNEFLNIFYS